MPKGRKRDVAADERLLPLLADPGLSFADVAGRAGMSIEQVRYRLMNLRRDGHQIPKRRLRGGAMPGQAPKSSPADRFLSAERERELARRRDAGDLSARDELAEKNLPLAKAAIARHARHHPGHADDLLSAAYAALVHAADTFDPGRGRFTTHAAWTIRGAITHWYAAELMVIRVPDQWHWPAYRADPANAEAAAEYDRLKLCRPAGSAVKDADLFGGIVGDDGPEGQGAGPDPEHLATLSAALDRLIPRHREIYERYHGLGGRVPETLQGVGKSFGLSKERIRQIVAKSDAIVRAAVLSHAVAV